jgi:hypothetical protein
MPPVTGAYLFAPRGRVGGSRAPGAEDVNAGRAAYTESTLARAVRDGTAANGRKLSYLMPRFHLDADSMAKLIAYLKHLSSTDAPGVTADTLHFATVITPDADPAGRRAMLDVMEHFFAAKNQFIRGGVRPMVAAGNVDFRVTRRWQLHVWELSGDASTWGRQLDMKLAQEPVFAVLSGIGGREWAPIHRFCEQQALPCFLPNVDFPVANARDFYSVYFSRGVLLEADLIANEIRDSASPLAGRPPVERVVQLYREGDIGEGGARQLHGNLTSHGLETLDRVLPRAAAPAELVAALRDLGPTDGLVLWLRPDDLAALPPAVPASERVYASGLMARLEHAPLAAAWRHVAHLTYPFDLPTARRFRTNFALGWLRIQRIPVTDERIQANTYLACGILAEILADMQDSFVRDYLLETTEAMLSHRLVTGYFPRLGLGSGQRFASKGGYLVHFAGDTGEEIAADGAWRVP